MAAQTDMDRREVEFALPTFGAAPGHRSPKLLSRLGDVADDFEELGLRIRNATDPAPAERPRWGVTRLNRPPTVEDIGALLLLIDYADTEVDRIKDTLEQIKSAIPQLDDMRIEERVTNA